MSLLELQHVIRDVWFSFWEGAWRSNSYGSNRTGSSFHGELKDRIDDLQWMVVKFGE